MVRIPSIPSIATHVGATLGAQGFAIAGAIGVAGIISIKTITPKTITKS